MSSGVLVATNHMMNRGDARVKRLPQSSVISCTKSNENRHLSHIMSSYGRLLDSASLQGCERANQRPGNPARHFQHGLAAKVWAARANGRAAIVGSHTAYCGWPWRINPALLIDLPQMPRKLGRRCCSVRCDGPGRKLAPRLVALMQNQAGAENRGLLAASNLYLGAIIRLADRERNKARSSSRLVGTPRRIKSRNAVADERLKLL